MSEDPPPSPPGLPPARGDSPVMVMVGATAILVCFLGIRAPGLLIVLLILATPAWIRAVITLLAAGRPLKGWSVVSVFLSSLGVVVLAVVAFGVLFGFTCSTVTLLTAGVGARAGSIIIGIVCGLIPGLVAARYVLRDLWSRKATHATERPHVSGNDPEPLP